MAMEIALDMDPGQMGYQAWVLGDCIYKCGICDRQYFDRLDIYTKNKL